MELFFLIILFVFGAMFGSFSSVVIYRIRIGEGGIVGGRSHCPKCDKTLSALELIPIFSWLIQGGKCKGCKTSIPVIYPLLELTMGVLFMLVGYTLISFQLLALGDITEWGRLLFFLTIIFLTVVFVFYDILYLEIPENILFTLNILLFLGLITQGMGIAVFPYLPIGNFDILTTLLCLSVLSGLYAIVLAGLKDIQDCMILGLCIAALYLYFQFFDISLSYSALLSGTIAALGVYISFFLQILLSKGRAMGAGDLRIAISMGLICGVVFAFPAWMICYLVGSIVGVGIIIIFKIKNGIRSGFNNQIPFGPFIASGYLSVLFFSPQIQNFIEWYIG